MAEGARPLRFTKMHGAGNDFIVLDLRDGTAPPSPALCRAMADRHRGVGCDQILTIEPPREAGSAASYRIWNSDGSPSGQCGNGARCVAAWLWRDGAITDRSFQLDSPGRSHHVELLEGGNWRISMGVPDFDPAGIPVLGFDGPRDPYVIATGGSILGFGAVSMGNPHAVLEVPDLDAADVTGNGAQLQALDAFPESANIGFAQVQARDSIRLRVFERGAGETLACGSGACAAVAVLVRRGLVDRAVTVHLPGGDLHIDWPADDAPVAMAGPAAFVFEGEWLHD